MKTQNVLCDHYIVRFNVAEDKQNQLCYGLFYSSYKQLFSHLHYPFY